MNAAVSPSVSSTLPRCKIANRIEKTPCVCLDLKFKVFSATRRPSIAILSSLDGPRKESVILTRREEGIFRHIFPAVSIALIGCSPSEKLVEHTQRPLLVAQASDAGLVEFGHEDVRKVNTASISELQLEESAMARGAGRRGGLGVPKESSRLLRVWM
jgi:hypothetical protein